MSYRVEPTENEAGRVYCASGNTFLELNDGDSQVKEGSFRKTVNLKEISFSVLQCGYLYCHYYK